MLKSWEARETEYAQQHLTPPEGLPPLFISQIRSQRANTAAVGHLYGKPTADDDDAGPPALIQPNTQLLMGGINDNFDSSLEPYPMAADLGATDWNYWNDLMQGAESSEMMKYDTHEICDQGSTLSCNRG